MNDFVIEDMRQALETRTLTHPREPSIFERAFKKLRKGRKR